MMLYIILFIILRGKLIFHKTDCRKNGKAFKIFTNLNLTVFELSCLTLAMTKVVVKRNDLVIQFLMSPEY